MKITADEIKKYINERISAGDKVTVKMVAGHYKVSCRWIEGVFKTQAGTTPKEYIQYSEFLYWIECLLYDKSVLTKCIHEEMGVSRSTFYRCLKKYSFHSAKHYRLNLSRLNK